MWGCQIPVDCLSNELCKIYGNGIAYHLLHIGLTSRKPELLGKSLDIASFQCGEWSDAFF